MACNRPLGLVLDDDDDDDDDNNNKFTYYYYHHIYNNNNDCKLVIMYQFQADICLCLTTSCG
jgi:hypothetical protein